jgi:hypothetical protein
MRYAILIPTHPPKFYYAVNALNSFVNFVKNGDLFFIFSNEGDYLNFKSLTNQHFNYLIISENSNFGNVISIKKMFGGLKIFEQGYDYVGVLDSEILFVKDFDMSELESCFNKKIIKANTTLDGGRLIKKSAEILGYGEKISKISKNYTEFWGFNEITIYEKNSFIEFLNWLQSIGTYNEILNDGEYFECFLYTIWLIVNKGFITENYLPNRKFVYGILDHNFYDIGISKIYNSIMDANVNHSDVESMKIRFCVDREINSGLYLEKYWEVKN